MMKFRKVLLAVSAAASLALAPAAMAEEASLEMLLVSEEPEDGEESAEAALFEAETLDTSGTAPEETLPVEVELDLFTDTQTSEADAAAEETGTVSETTLTLSKSEATLVTNGSDAETKLTLTAAYSGEAARLSYSSSDESVASVTGSATTAVVTAKKGGSTVITVTDGSLTATCTVTVHQSALRLNYSSLSLNTGDSRSAVLTATQEYLTGTVGYSSSNPAVATVDASGNVTAVAAGSSVITASLNGLNATCTVTVLKSELVLDKTSVTLNTTGSNQTAVLTAKLINLSGTVSFASSNPAVVVVDGNGNLTAKKAGSSVITASAGGVNASCNVTVTKSSMKLNKKKVQLNSGGTKKNTFRLKATLTNVSGTVKFSSGNKKIAKVDASTGLITAKKAGKCKITAKIGNLTRTCKVIVKKSSLTLNAKSVTLNNTNNKSYKLKAYRKNLKGKITYTSSDESVVTVASNGRITAVGPGSAKVTAACGKTKATCKVTVKASSISLNQTSASLNTAGTTNTSVQLTVQKYNISGNPTFSSSNPGVASVNANGLVTAVGAGTAIITARLSSLSASCTVTVYQSTLTVSPSSLSLKVTDGNKETGKINVSYSHIAGSLVYRTSNSSVATIDSNGVVTAQGAGSCTITVSAGSLSRSVAVTVTSTTTSFNVYTSNGTLLNSTTILSMSAGESTTVHTSPSVNASYSSNNTSVVRCNGATLTAVAAGNATITVRYGSTTRTFGVSVK